jgi:hypothetical protein
MTALYWFAVIVGAGLLLLSLAGDIFGDFFGGDVDVDVDTDVDAEGHGQHGDVQGFRILSTRNLTYFMFGFGTVGILLGWLTAGERPIVTAATATVLGIAAAAIAAVAFGYVGRTESGTMLNDRGWVGLVGEVIIPLSADSTGKILVARGGRQHELLAQPFERDPEAPAAWRSVMVLEMRNGIALVSPQTGTIADGDRLRISPSTESDDNG